MLDQPKPLAEVSLVIKATKNHNPAGSDGIAGEVIKYGGKQCVKHC